MGKLTTGTAIGVGGVGTLVVAAAQTKPEDAASNIAGWLKWVGVDRIPDALASAQADTWATAVGLLIVFLAAMAWLLWRKRRTPDFNNVNAWSVSVDLGCMASSHEGAKMTRYIRYI